MIERRSRIAGRGPPGRERARRSREPCRGAGIVLASLALLSPAHADAPPGRFVKSGDVITDTVTKLQWQATQGAARDRGQALQACTLATTGGVGGWRAPSLRELQTIVDVRRSSPALDPAFGAGGATWSGDPVAGGIDTYWILDFAYGYTQTQGAADPAGVRCVR